MASVAEFIDLGMPVAFAGATYGIFHWIDEKASEEAKVAISGWFKPLQDDRSAIHTAILEIFDKIYGRPLLAWRSFARSAIITIFLTVIYITLYTPAFDRRVEMAMELLPMAVALIFNILTDYVSLFVVRRWLNMQGHSYFFVLIGGALAGVSVVLLLYVLREFIDNIIIGLYFDIRRPNFYEYLGWLIESILGPNGMEAVHRLVILPAFATHMWLPLLAISAVLVKIANSLLWSVGWMQWFLKQGHEHPLEAIGYVAGALVMAIMAVVHWIA